MLRDPSRYYFKAIREAFLSFRFRGLRTVDVKDKRTTLYNILLSSFVDKYQNIIVRSVILPFWFYLLG